MIIEVIMELKSPVQLNKISLKLPTTVTYCWRNFNEIPVRMHTNRDVHANVHTSKVLQYTTIKDAQQVMCQLNVYLLNSIAHEC